MTERRRLRAWWGRGRDWDAGLAAAHTVAPASRLGLAWVPLAALLLAALLASSPLQERWQAALHDASVRAVARPQQYAEVLVVDIDDASLRALRPRLGAWPYGRDVFALVIGYLRELGAKVVVLDVVLAEPREGDEMLSRTLAERGDVVLAAAALKRAAEPDGAPERLRRQLSWPADAERPALAWPAITLPAEPLLTALASASGPGAIGVVSTPLDADGLLRRLPLLHEVGGRVYPSPALAAHLLTPEDPGDVLQRGHRELRLGERRWPVGERGELSFLLPKNPDAVPSMAFSTLMAAALGMSEGAGLRETVRGRAVFVGSSAFLADDVMTPHGPLSGSTLLASAYASLARGEVLGRATPALTALLTALALAPSVWICLRRRPALAHDALASLGALLVLLVGGLAALALGRLELPLAFPLSVVAFGFVLAALLQLRWIGLANRQLGIERAVADAANRAKTEFLANVSHEIRTPMNALLGVAELLQRTPLNLEQQRYVEVFRRSGQTLFELINDLLDLSKIEAGRLDLEPRPFSLHRLLDDQHELLSAKATAKGLTLGWERDPALPDTVVGDRRRLAQVLTNLIGNAIKFTPSGRVDVAVVAEPEGLRFTVRDTGIGISDDQQKRIFEPFVQVDGSATRVYGGTGLGLSIARSLVERMGGRIELRSQAGAGSSFSFRVPLPATELAPAPEPRDALPGSPALARPEALAWDPEADLPPWNPAVDPPYRVLLTEDNDVNALLVEAMLRGTGVELDVAPDGETALQRFRQRRYDLVLMDVQMPGIDGHEATRQMRRIEAEQGWARIPVIALTAHAFASDMQRSLDAGCDAHLAKPVSRAALLAAVDRFRRGSGPAPDRGAPL